jgi:thiol reductant ABC exporter CydC subunit
VEAVDVAETADELAAYGAAGDRLDAIATRERELQAHTRREAHAVAFGDGLETVIAGATAAALLVAGAGAVRSGALDQLLLATLVLLGWALPEIAGGMPLAFRRATALRASVERVTGVLDAADPVPDPATQIAPPHGPLAIHARGLVVRWPDARQPTLTQVDLDLPAGSRTVIVGPSGAGKSTLAATLVRFLPVEHGTLTIGGVDVTLLRGDDVRRLVGWCVQDAHFFDSTIADNLRVARPDATDGDLEAAVAAVHLDAWLRALPDGLRTRVGVAGTRLSGGEAQRLALARELLADRPIVVLDEPTANVDASAADALVGDLLDAAGDRTVLMITHRTTGLERADQVVELVAGRTRAAVLPVAGA